MFIFYKTFQCTLAVTDFTPFMGFESCVTFSEEGDRHNIYLHKDTFPLSLYSVYSRFYFQGLITIKLKARQGLPSCQIKKKKNIKTILMAWRLIISYFQVLNKLQLFSHSSWISFRHDNERTFLHILLIFFKWLIIKVSHWMIMNTNNQNLLKFFVSCHIVGRHLLNVFYSALKNC